MQKANSLKAMSSRSISQNMMISQNLFVKQYLFCCAMGILVILWNLQLYYFSHTKSPIVKNPSGKTPIVRKMQQLVADLENDLVDYEKMSENRDLNVSGWYSKDGGHYECIKSKRFVWSQVKLGEQAVKQRFNCDHVAAEDVELLGVVAAHHKSGTVFRRGFYYAVCALQNVNYASVEGSTISSSQNHSMLTWDRSFKNQGCMDFHPCNTRGIIHAKMAVRDTCVELGVKCRDWFDLKCYIEQCQQLLQLDPTVKVINPIRNPFDMVTSAYKYHKGNSPEDWANTKTLQEIGLWRADEDEGMDFLLNETLSNALQIYNLNIGLELAYRVMSNDILDMTLLHKISSNNKNVMESRFEDCAKDFNLAMKNELDFFNFYDQNATYQEKRLINSVGLWVVEEKNLQAQQEQKHIAKDSSNKQVLNAAVLSHPRFEQLSYMAQIMGYSAPTQQ